MLGYIKLLYLLISQIIFVQCYIPNSLSVKKIDSKLIHRKRLDNFRMCKMFNAETDRLLYKNNEKIFKNKVKFDDRKRVKRELSPPKLINGVPSLRQEDAERVEQIVDKIYDDMTENGKPVTYRHRPLEGKSTTVKNTPEVAINQSGRRYDFAPAVLLPPLKSGSSAQPPPETVAINWVKKWKHGIVPYFIDPKTYDSQLAEIIIKAFDYFEKGTCIRLQRLREKPIDKKSLKSVEWIYITNPIGIRQCVHSNEKIPNKGVQMVVFGYDCMSTGEIFHEVMHILGFSHEHTREDRANHITVFWDNIKPGYKKYFETRPEDSLLRLPYDYSSVLHYPARAFSKNGKVTLFAKNGVKLGQRDGLSPTDLDKVNLIFGGECVNRNNDYLLTTCPTVVKTAPKAKTATQEEIQNYFKDKLWPYGIVNYRLRDAIEFSSEEIENLLAVIKHIEKETCIQFRDITADKEELDEHNEEDEGTDNADIDRKYTKIRKNKVDSDENNIDSQENTVNSKEDAEIKTNETIVDNSVSSTKPATTPGKRVKRTVKQLKGSRRHSDGILTLARTPDPGCRCPQSGTPDSDSVLELSGDCFNSVNDLLHVFVHVLGLDHQHNMHDRDQFLHIVWDKLTPELKAEMQQKLPPAAAVGFPYDYQSVMHYPWLQIKDGVTTIMYPIWNDGWAMGHWQGLSSTDVQKLNLLYFEQCLERKKLDTD